MKNYKQRVIISSILIIVLIGIFLFVCLFESLKEKGLKDIEKPAPSEKNKDIKVLGIDEVEINPETGLPYELENLAKVGEKFKKRNLTYLEKEWQNILLKNKVISAIDSFFRKITWVFRILFGEHYSLSFVLFIIIVLWFIIALKVAEISKAAGMERGVSYAMGVIFAIIISQLRLLRIIIEFVGNFIFSQKYTWARYLLMGVVGIIFILFYYLSTALSKYMEEARKKAKERAAELAEEKITKLTEKMIETAEKGEV